ncbi:MAG: iron-sulfur cluster-binding domain-containing protein [Pseudomonadota bacterium]
MIQNIPPLFSLFAGMGLFLILLLGFRLLSLEMERKSAPPLEDDEIGKIELILLNSFEEAKDVRSFVFAKANGKNFSSFKAGQFVSFQIGNDPRTLRSYSISSSPETTRSLQVSVKALPGGVGSHWMHSLKPGDKVLAFSPSGLFVDEEHPTSPKIYVAGGIGITPFVSMLLGKATGRDLAEVALFYGMRTTKDMAFHDLLVFLSKRMPNFKYFPILSEPDPEWADDKGFITLAFINSKISFLPDHRFFFCGPPIMTDTIVASLKTLGISGDRIHTEKFVSPVTFDRSALQSRKLKLTWNGTKVDYQGTETILEGLEKANISHPFACRVGVCGSCKCKVTGKFSMITDAGLTPEEKKSGLCLACVAFPEEDMEIRVT